MPFGLKDLGKNIKAIRLARKSLIRPGKPMLQYELAERAGVPASSLCNIEKGKYANPTWDILSKIAAGLQCEVSDFFVSPEKQVSPSQLALSEMIDLIIKERLERILEKRVR